MELTISQALQQGVAAHKEGKLQDAERHYRAILQAQPKHPDANHNLGVLAVAVGKPLEAIPLFELALEANPKVEQFWLSYIDLLLRLERLVEAQQALIDAEQSGVSSEEIHSLRQGLQNEDAGRGAPSREQLEMLQQYHKDGQLIEAEALALSFTQTFPAHKISWSALGNILLQLGKPRESIEALRKCLSLSPLDAAAHYNLGFALHKLNKLEEAEASYQQSVILQPDYAKAHCQLGKIQKKMGKVDEAITSLRRAVKYKPNYWDAHNFLGGLLPQLGWVTEAEASFRSAIACEPDNPKSHYNLGGVLEMLGRFDEAIACYESALRLKPDFIEALVAYSSISALSREDAYFLQMLKLHRERTLSHQEQHTLCFGLARISENLGDFATAFRYYEEGNSLRKQKSGYDREKEERLFCALKARHANLVRQSLQEENIRTNLTPIFITGMPRSGTSLIEQIISSSSLVTGAGELPYVGQFGGTLAVGQTPIDQETLKIFRGKYLKALQRHAQGSVIVTDKMPHNFRFLGLIVAALPEAKIIHVRRDPAAVCWANYSRNFTNDLAYAYSIKDILHHHELYEDLMEYWHQALPGRIYDLDYERLTENQEDETRRLIDYLGLEWSAAYLAPQDNKRAVTTAAAQEIRKKIHMGRSERWRRYRPFLNGALDHFSARDK